MCLSVRPYEINRLPQHGFSLTYTLANFSKNLSRHADLYSNRTNRQKVYMKTYRNLWPFGYGIVTTAFVVTALTNVAVVALIQRLPLLPRSSPSPWTIHYTSCANPAHDPRQGQDRPWGLPSILPNGYQDHIPLDSCGRSESLTTHLHLVPKLRMDGAIPPIPHIPSWRV